MTEAVRKYLGQCVEVQLTDGRLISGVLCCTDKDANFVLNRAEERWESDEQPRHIGMAMIAKRHVSKMVLLSDSFEHSPFF
ncbi:unnamed protein product [Auanema sp. JU1783]|nr:unnamed protein product [Auanema sp. JU1783]